MAIRLLPLGGGNEIGASAYFLDVHGEYFLLDCGVRLNGPLYYPDFSPLFQLPVDGLWELKGVFITHAHFDHVGGLPRLYPEARDVPVYTTPQTAQLARLQLESMGTGAGRSKKHSRKRQAGEPADSDFGLRVYPASQVRRSLEMINCREYGRPVEFCGCRVTFFPAGHILGASMVYLETAKKNILYSGDFSDFDQFTVPACSLPENIKVDILIVESTYGFRDGPSSGDGPINEEASPLWQPGTTPEAAGKCVSSVPATAGWAALRAQEMENFVAAVAGTVWQYGNVLIPAFAVGRSQEVARLLSHQMAAGMIPSFPVFIDGIAAAATELYEENGIPVYDEHVQKAPATLVERVGEQSGIAVISSSGMLLAGSRSARYAANLLPNGRNALHFSGYLQQQSPGNRLRSAAGNGSETISLHGLEIPLRAHVGSYHLSAHADHLGIMQLIERLQPSTVVFVHGCPRQNSGLNILEDAYAAMPDVQYFQACNGYPLYL